jgi:hypothetical protein
LPGGGILIKRRHFELLCFWKLISMSSVLACFFFFLR